HGMHPGGGCCVCLADELLPHFPTCQEQCQDAAYQAIPGCFGDDFCEGVVKAACAQICAGSGKPPRPPRGPGPTKPPPRDPVPPITICFLGPLPATAVLPEAPGIIEVIGGAGATILGKALLCL